MTARIRSDEDDPVRAIAERESIPFLTSAGSMVLFSRSDAKAFAQVCSDQQIVILGLEGFDLRDDAIVPDISAIADFSGVTDADLSVRSTFQFLDELPASDLVFEFVVGSTASAQS